MASEESHFALLPQLVLLGTGLWGPSSVHLWTAFPYLIFEDQMWRRPAPPTLGISPGLSTLHSPKLGFRKCWLN